MNRSGPSLPGETAGLGIPATTEPLLKRRASGVLCHITSLPSPFGCGDLGPWAYRFADLLADGGQTYWQVLPLTPTEPALGNSPYMSPSAFAGNTLLISPELLVDDGYLIEDELRPLPAFSGERVDFPAAIRYRRPQLDRAAARFLQAPPLEFEAFVEREAAWLDDYCLFVACRERFGGSSWNEWPDEIRARLPQALDRARSELRERYDRERALQYLFFDQWRRLRRYCADQGVRLIGDLPIYVAYDSADVWARPELFKLDGDRRPEVVAGVPPDCFAANGQRWGNPVYRWAAHRHDGYAWWVSRFGHLARLYDVTRVDHFCGFVTYWEIASSEATALRGIWQPGPGEDLFARVYDAFPDLALIAEDMGLVSDDVGTLLDLLDIPGMRVLLLGLGPDMPANRHVPHNHDRPSVLYLGTHDNPTARGWFEAASAEDRERLGRYLGRPAQADTVAGELVRLCMQSVSTTLLVALQDLLELGGAARMNTPGTTTGNWEWRCTTDDLSPELAIRLADLSATYGRRAPTRPSAPLTGHGTVRI
jgi:4-alpha-glucanotransferase